MKGNSVGSSIIYKTMEKYTIMAFQLAVQIVIARILDPSHYGIIAMMTVFIHVSFIFIDNGFNMALVQKKDAKTIDYSTAFSINFIIGIVLYILLFLAAPAISNFYAEPLLVKTLRVMALLLPISAVSSIQTAIASREMQFRHLFLCNVLGSVVSGIIGISTALLGFGVWALICQQLTNRLVITCALLYRSTWKPHFSYCKESARSMFSFGWKMLFAGFINSLYTELNSLIIGKKYTSADLAFYTKGKSFPHLVTMGLDSALSSVMFSAFSKKQDDKENLYKLFHKTLAANTYILFPIIVLLGLCAKPFTIILLTEKWLPMIPYLQICCFTFVFHPMASLDMQAIAAVGRSDVRLKLEFIKKPFGILLLLLSMNYGPIAVAISAAVTSIFSLIVGAIACDRIVGYSFLRHFKDIIPTIVVTMIMGVPVYYIGNLQMSAFLLLPMQVIVGVSVYLILSLLFKLEAYSIVKNRISNYKHK